MIDVVTLAAAVALVRALPAPSTSLPGVPCCASAASPRHPTPPPGWSAAGARFIPGNPSVVMSGVALGIAGAGYATVHDATPGSLDATDGRAHEDVSRTISTPSRSWPAR